MMMAFDSDVFIVNLKIFHTFLQCFYCVILNRWCLLGFEQGHITSRKLHSIYLSIYLSMYLYIYLSIYLSIYRSFSSSFYFLTFQVIASFIYFFSYRFVCVYMYHSKMAGYSYLSVTPKKCRWNHVYEGILFASTFHPWKDCSKTCSYQQNSSHHNWTTNKFRGTKSLLWQC